MLFIRTIIFSLLLLIGLITDSTSKLEFGKYTSPTPSFSFQEIIVSKDSTFHRNESGCLGETNDKGKWIICGDTLIAISQLREKTKNGKKDFYQVNDLQCCKINKYIIKKDTLLYIDKKLESEVLYISDTLIKNRRPLKGKRQKF